MTDKTSREYKTRRSKLVILEIDKNKKQLINIILFRNKKWDKFVTLGGRVDKKDIDFETALIREVKEESHNSIDISDVIYFSNRVTYIDFCDERKNEIVRVYFILINNGLMDKTIYDTNKRILNNQNLHVPRCWMELDDYDKFPINSFLQKDDETDLEKCVYCKNVTGEEKKIYTPILRYIKEAKRRKLIDKLVNEYSIVDKYSVKKNVSNNFLNGTITIQIK